MPIKWLSRRRARRQKNVKKGWPFPSRTYGFIRGRELEGTYPGPPDIGSWILTTQRVTKGWGHLPDRFWPYVADEWPAKEPPGLDAIAKAERTRSYVRCRTLEDCRKVLEGGGMVLASFEIDDSWTSSEGLIDDPRLHRPQMTHSIIFLGDDLDSETLGFSHNWGPFWGDGGFGDLPYRYWFDRLLEAWIPDERQAAFVPRPPDCDFLVVKRDAPDHWGNQIHLIEIEDPSRDEMMGWAIARHSADAGLELEEFFVRPAFRGRGHGSRLARAVAELRASLGVPLSAWIPHVDASPTAAQDAIFKLLRLERGPSPERWAASRVTEIER
jgi:GNAT superfamily N-acetyltransferase